MILVQQASRGLGKDKQNVKYSCGQRHFFTAAQAYPVRWIDLKIAENVSVTVCGNSVFIVVSVFQFFSDFFLKIRTTPLRNSDTKSPVFEGLDYKPISSNRRWFGGGVEMCLCANRAEDHKRLGHVETRALLLTSSGSL